ncbi:ribonuclease D [Moritella viscosa]|uniref:Ribonuclease D n=1 Tax=Moritella viscosa TaxID=80854 RepID=A0A1L0ABD3_9GAMM|nr:ribonuclease D [Moritella viscosa]SGY98676.1 RNase D, processes tRNA [Moritella viscosa]SGZ05592.1 RNase D, processes tRNA [Moritella viscosa]SGZ12767.1 RNase D, processes tRNA [Moritella viscosa]SGZ12905.1 RNase D, processes tRNA [Moritella viscosa]SHO13022.1 RNase D, processes tRNA [Moritella viscosa]
MEYILVEDQITLQKMIAQCAEVEILAIDTEFIRQRTYYPILGLFQLYNGTETYLVDPLAIDDLSALWQLLDRQPVVLHACSEDLDVFMTVANKFPDFFHDTQIAAAFCGLGSSLGFGGLVSEFQNITLDKGESRSNWLARPLTTKQLSYAAADVYHLLPCWHELKSKLDELGYYDFYLQELDNLRRRKMVNKNPKTVYKQFKNASFLSPRELATLQALAEWREDNAVNRDMAVNFVVKEAHLLEVAKQQPKSLRDLNQLGLLPIEIKRHGKQIIDLVKQAQSLSDEALPEPLTRISDYPGYKKIVLGIRNKIAVVAEKTNIPAELIGSKKIINELLNWVWKLTEAERAVGSKPILLSNWRAELIGNSLFEGLMANK